MVVAHSLDEFHIRILGNWQADECVWPEAEIFKRITMFTPHTVADLLNRVAAKVDGWADESLSGGWSTHQVKANRTVAAELRLKAAEIEIPGGARDPKSLFLDWYHSADGQAAREQNSETERLKAAFYAGRSSQ